MKNGLIKKIGKKVLPFVIGGLSLINGGCQKEKYEIDGRQVELRPNAGQLIDRKVSGNVWYYFNLNDKSLYKVNAKSITSMYTFLKGDSLFNEFECKFEYFMNKADSLREIREQEIKNSPDYKKKIEIGKRALQ